MTPDELIELMADAAFSLSCGNSNQWYCQNENVKNAHRESEREYLAILTTKGLAIVPVEPTLEQRKHVHNLVSIFVADDDHLRDVTEDLIVRSYRAMVRAMIAVEG